MFAAIAISESSRVSNPDNLSVNVSRDEQEGVWHVVSSDVPGLNAEAQTLDELIEIVADLAPDLIAANLPVLAVRHPSGVPLSVQQRESFHLPPGT
jgi:hypothetical protein